jgi:hypothetical protein
LPAATGGASDGEASVKAAAGAEEIASIAAPAKAAANPPTRIRFTILSLLERSPARRI